MNYAIPTADDICNLWAKAKKTYDSKKSLEDAIASYEAQARIVEGPLQESKTHVIKMPIHKSKKHDLPRSRDVKRFLYFLECGEFVKIGTTKDIKYRLKELQCGNPYDVRIICFFANKTFRDEFYIHAKLKEYRHCGEWFALPENMINEIKSLPNGAGLEDIEAAIRRGE
jgi:hypothetical protein